MRLTIKGFKAHDRDIDLSRLNLVCAPNGKGKSAIADALRFLALGYVPALGKREQDTALLMSNGDLSVTLTLDDGRTATRTLSRDGKAIFSTVKASWVRGSRAEHEAAILKLFGSDEEDVAEALDVRELLSLSPAKRAARIEKMVGSSSGADDLPRRVARQHVARLLDIDVDQLPEKLSEAMANLPLSRAKIIAQLAGTMSTSLRENGIPAVIEWANTAKREAEAAAKRRHAAQAEIEARLATMGGTLAIDDLEAQRATLQQQAGAHNEYQRREAARQKQYDEAASEQARIEPTLTQAVEVLDRIETTAREMIATCEENIPGYDEAIGALRSQVFAVNVDAKRLEQLEAQVININDEPVEDVTRYERMVEDFEQELAGIKANPWAEVREIADEIDEVHSVAGWGGRLRVLAEANMPKTGDTEAVLASARETLKTRGDAAAAAATRNVERATQRAKLTAEIEDLSAKAGSADASVRERERKRDVEIEGITRKKNAALGVIVDQREKVEAQRQHVATLREKLSALTARVLALSGAIAVPQPPDMGELERIQTAIEAATSRTSLKAELDTIVKDIELRDAEVDVYRSLEWALTRIREEDLAEKGGGIVARISDFLQAAGRSELPYMESSKGVCEIGWVRDDKRRVSIEAMSGGEYSLFCAALTAAVLSLRGGELRVLMIEAAEADSAMLECLLAGIEAIGPLTHSLVLTYQPPHTLTSEWRQIMLEPMAQERAA